MRHELRFATAALFLFAAAGFAWPGESPIAKQSPAKLRGLVEVQRELPAGVTKLGPKVEQEIELEILVVELDTNVAGPFFASKKGDKLVVGRLKQGDGESFRQALLDIRPYAVQRLGRVCRRNANGERSSLDLGRHPALFWARGTSNALWDPYAVLFEGTPTLRNEGDLNLEMNVVLSKAVWPAARDAKTDPTYEWTARATTQARLRAGETLVVGGLTQIRQRHEWRKVPLLSRLPGVGSYFDYCAYESYEAEILFVVTPRLIEMRPK